MHVVLFGAVGETLDPDHDRTVRLGDVDMEVDNVAGVLHPLTAHHELVVDRIAESIGHPAVKAPPSRPTPPYTAAARLATSSFSILLMVTISTIRLKSVTAGSAKALVLSST